MKIDLNKVIIREETKKIIKLLQVSPPIIHAIIGPRQVGKSTAAEQIAQTLNWPFHYSSADSPRPLTPEWIEAQWNTANLIARKSGQCLLILDEAQKIHGWSEVIKSLWDGQKKSGQKKRKEIVKPLILGSSALLLEQGLTESLAGRFLLHYFPHWSFTECQKAFDWSLDEWIYFGGYPGAAVFRSEEAIWKRYISDSLVDPAISRDVLQRAVVHKPALLRALFGIVCTYPAQVVSYNKMLGQLQDSGNTTTLAHYLDLLNGGYLVAGIQKFAKGQRRKRASSPKLIAWNNALVSSSLTYDFESARKNTTLWGRLVENAVGAHILNTIPDKSWHLSYWQDSQNEVDFVISQRDQIFALEVKSGLPKTPKGLSVFKSLYPKSSVYIIGSGGVPLEEFFSQPISEFLV